MKRNFVLWQWVGFAAVAAGGTLLHFLYEWSGDSRWVAPFSGVNESTWEHMKLLYFPWLVFALVERRFFPDYKRFWCVKQIGILTGLIAIPVLFYTLNGAFGKTPDWLNISIYYIAAAILFLAETKLFQRDLLPCKHPIFAFVFILSVGFFFFFFTFLAPEIPLFRDPINGSYGI